VSTQQIKSTYTVKSENGRVQVYDKEKPCVIDSTATNAKNGTFVCQQGSVATVFDMSRGKLSSDNNVLAAQQGTSTLTVITAEAAENNRWTDFVVLSNSECMPATHSTKRPICTVPVADCMVPEQAVITSGQYHCAHTRG
jgi:hypothetical protein